MAETTGNITAGGSGSKIDKELKDLKVDVGAITDAQKQHANLLYLGFTIILLTGLAVALSFFGLVIAFFESQYVNCQFKHSCQTYYEVSN